VRSTTHRTTAAPRPVVTGPERDLVAECCKIASVAGVYLELVGQRRAKGSGSTIGFPDGVLYCNGRAALIEFKRIEGGRLSRAQQIAMQLREEQGVKTHVVRTAQEFADIIAWCRRAGRVIE
jgi:hypothetical protein